MRRVRVVVVLAVVGLLLAPSVEAIHTATPRVRVEPLREATWYSTDGEERTGLSGAGVVVANTHAYDQTHPDLDHCGTMEHQYWRGVAVPRNPEPHINAHDTMVVGVICGSGQASDGLHVGVAPAVQVFGTGGCSRITGTVSFSTCQHPLADWHAHFNLRLHLTTSGGDPLMSASMDGLPEDADVLFVQSAGNYGGDGSTAKTLTHDNQTDPRYVRVAAGDGYRTGVASYSSRGDRANPETWPHLTAPACGWAPTPPDDAKRAFDPIAVLLPEANCPDVMDESALADPDSPWYRSVEWYSKGGGTSMAAPFVAGVSALMFEVHPGLSAADARYLLTRTADPFLPTEDADGNGTVDPEEFWDQHGYKAGYGYVNATAAVAAAHYLALHGDASVAEAVACSATGRTPAGRLVLNPAGSSPCGDPGSSAASAGPDGRPPAEGADDGEAADAGGGDAPGTAGDPAPSGHDEGGGQDARTVAQGTVPGSGVGAVALVSAAAVAVLAAIVWSGRRR